MSASTFWSRSSVAIRIDQHLSEDVTGCGLQLRLGLRRTTNAVVSNRPDPSTRSTGNADLERQKREVQREAAQNAARMRAKGF